MLGAFVAQAPNRGTSHLAGADDDDGHAAELTQARFCCVDGGGGNRDRFVADAGLRTRVFAGVERFAEEPVQGLAQRLCVLRLNVCVFDLPEDLSFADEHRV